MIPYDFRDPKDRNILRTMWVYQPPLKNEYPITGINNVCVIINGKYVTAANLLKHYRDVKTGQPCGKEEITNETKK